MKSNIQLANNEYRFCQKCCVSLCIIMDFDTTGILGRLFDKQSSFADQ